MEPRNNQVKKILAQLIESFRSVSFNYMSCLKRQVAVALESLASMLKIFEETDLRPTDVETKDQPAYCHNI